MPGHVPHEALDWVRKKDVAYLAHNGSCITLRSTGTVCHIQYGADLAHGCRYEVSLDFLRWFDSFEVENLFHLVNANSTLFGLVSAPLTTDMRFQTNGEGTVGCLVWKIRSKRCVSSISKRCRALSKLVAEFPSGL